MAKRTILSILKQAKKYVQSGWTQGAYARPHKAADSIRSYTEARYVCALGAIEKACGMKRVNGFKTVQCHAVVEVFKRTNNIFDIVNWNDAGDRKKSTVVAAFTKAINKEQNRGKNG